MPNASERTILGSVSRLIRVKYSASAHAAMAVVARRLGRRCRTTQRASMWNGAAGVDMGKRFGHRQVFRAPTYDV